DLVTGVQTCALPIFAYLLTGNEADADDLVHEAFIRASGRFAHLTRPANFGAYLRRTLINLHINRLRRLRLERRYLGWLRRQPEEVGRAACRERDKRG